MTNSPEFSHVEIQHGIVRAQSVSDQQGTRPTFEHVGQHRFFVDVIEADGGRLGLWDGQSYEDAIREAEEIAADFGSLPVCDHVVGGSA